MTTPAEGINQIIVDAGLVGGASGWTSVVGGNMGQPKEVTLLDSGGRGGEVKVAIDYPSVQAIVVGSSAAGGYQAAFNKARSIYDLLLGIDTPHAAWDKLVSCIATNQPAWLGRDDGSRPRFSVNFNLIVTPEDIGNRTY